MAKLIEFSAKHKKLGTKISAYFESKKAFIKANPDYTDIRKIRTIPNSKPILTRVL